MHQVNDCEFHINSKLAESEDEPVPKDVIEKGVKRFYYYFVLISLVNILLSNIIFTGKLMALTCSILGTFYIIFGQESSLMLMLFFGACSFQALIFYTVSCQKAFGVPDLFARMRKDCKLLVNKKGNSLTPWDRKLFHYQIKAVPAIGIKDGGFRILRSESTLLFIDFYVNSVISLLLM